MVEYLSFTGNHLKNLRDQLDATERKVSRPAISTYFEQLNSHCHYLQLDLLTDRNIFLFQKPASSLSSPAGLLIYLFAANQAPSYGLDDTNI